MILAPLFASAILKRLSFLLRNNAGQLLSDISLKPVCTPPLFANDISVYRFESIYLFIFVQYCICELHSSLPEGLSNRRGAEESKRKPDWAAVKLQSCLSKCCSIGRNFTHWGSVSSWAIWSILNAVIIFTDTTLHLRRLNEVWADKLYQHHYHLASFISPLILEERLWEDYYKVTGQHFILWANS